MATTRLDTNTGPSSPGKTIKFDAFEDKQMRRNAKIAHDLSKELRDVRINFIRCVPILKDPAMMRKHGIKSNSKDVELLISLSGIESKDQAAIDDVMSFFLVREDFIIRHHEKASNSIYYFIISPMNVTIDEKEEKENMIREHAQQ